MPKDKKKEGGLTIKVAKKKAPATLVPPSIDMFNAEADDDLGDIDGVPLVESDDEKTRNPMDVGTPLILPENIDPKESLYNKVNALKRKLMRSKTPPPQLPAGGVAKTVATGTGDFFKKKKTRWERTPSPGSSAKQKDEPRQWRRRSASPEKKEVSSSKKKHGSLSPKRRRKSRSRSRSTERRSRRDRHRRRSYSSSSSSSEEDEQRHDKKWLTNKGLVLLPRRSGGGGPPTINRVVSAPRPGTFKPSEPGPKVRAFVGGQNISHKVAEYKPPPEKDLLKAIDSAISWVGKV